MLTWIEIKAKAINNNLKTFRKIIGKDRLLMPVIKSNAYGHGLELLAQICDKSPLVDKICVVNLEEALDLLKMGIKKNILILGIYEHDEEKIFAAIRKGVAFPLYTLEQAVLLQKIAKRAKKEVRVHLKIDTGTSRIGVLPSEAVSFAKKLQKFNMLVIEGLWSHFSSSENDPQTTKQQQSIFEKVEYALAREGIEIPLTHMACSASTLLYPTNCQAVRFGISLYGLHPDPSTVLATKLQPALAWKTKIIQVKHIPKGTKISYNGTFITKRDTTIAVLPVGYWDGLPRSLSNKGKVLIKGKCCPIRGRICMNLCMVEVTNIKNVKAGDVVTIIGRDGKKEITMEEQAELAGTINYELVARINPQIPRKLV